MDKLNSFIGLKPNKLAKRPQKHIDLRNQPQLMQIAQNPKMYEGDVSVPMMTSPERNNNVALLSLKHDCSKDYPIANTMVKQQPFQHSPLEQQNLNELTRQFEEKAKIGSPAVSNSSYEQSSYLLSHLHLDSNSNIMTHNQNDSKNSVSSYFTDISDNLYEKVSKNPQYNSIPFHVAPNNTNSQLPAITHQHSAIVPLPKNLGNPRSTNLWDIAHQTLLKLKLSCQNNNATNLAKLMQTTIQSYRPDSSRQSNFQMLNRPDISSTIISILPLIVDQAIALPHILASPIPYLLNGENKTIYLSRKLCSSLLANAFFCTFPEPNIGSIPDFNFFRLYNDTQSQRCEVKKEKIKCILNYFYQMSITKDNKDFHNQIVSFERRYVQKKVDWSKDSSKLCQVLVEPNRKIEQAHEMLQVDFANKVVGGGVLNDGSVMEEIRFCISPELLVSRLFTQTLNDDEVLVVTGTEIFSEYTGYSTSFTFSGQTAINFGKQNIDNFGRTFTQVVAMDASSFKRNETTSQFQKRFIDRELHKANVAFMHGSVVTPIATGNWGCGAFNGDPELKFILQWIAASHQGRPCIVYHTIGNQRQTQSIEEVNMLIKESGITTGDLYEMTIRYSREAGYQQGSLFRYIKNKIGMSGGKNGR